MKKHTLLFILVLFLMLVSLIHGAEAQKKYAVRVKLIDNTEVKGTLLYAAGDSLGIATKKSEAKKLRLSEIKSIRVRTKGRPGKGAALGAAIGAGLGGLIGLATYQSGCSGGQGTVCFDFGPAANVVVGGILGIAVGSIVGVVAGSSHKQIKIETDPAQFDFFKSQFSMPAASKSAKP